MNILGIETSCDETAAAIVKDGRQILSQHIRSQMDTHALFGGVVPEVASRQHVGSITKVVEMAFQEAGCTWSDVDAIAVTCGPGLLGALLVGVAAAKGYALATGLPLLGVHHIAGHVAAALLSQDVQLPVLALVVSGGHTELLVVDEQFRFRKLGGTIDDAAGEAYDKVARLLGLAYPGGPRVDALAAQGDGQAFQFPRSLLDAATEEKHAFNFSFSGVKTAVANELTKRRNTGQPIPVENVCASFKQAVIEVLVEKTARAVQSTGLTQVVLAGGVAANQGLRRALTDRAEQDGFALTMPPLELCTDNAAMIATAGYYQRLHGRVHDLSLNAYATLSLETWQNTPTL